MADTGISGWQLVRNKHNESTAKVLRFALTVSAIVIPIQIFVGDLHGLNTLKHQPAKIAAVEAIWNTEKSAPLVLFGIPDEQQKKTHYAIEIPKVASLILTHRADGEIKGLNEFGDAHPPVMPVFLAFRIMVGIASAMLVVSWLGAWLIWRRRSTPPWFNWALVAMTFSGWIATVAGWYVTEIGRQPYIVYGLVFTKQVASNTPPAHIALTLAAYLTLYVVLIVSYVAVLRYMAEKPLDDSPNPLSTREEVPNFPASESRA